MSRSLYITLSQSVNAPKLLPNSIMSPKSPITPKSPTPKYCIKSVLESKGYQHPKKVSDALQGSIWETSKQGSNYIIKVINKSLHRNHITYVNKKEIAIEENIIKESAILKYLTNNHPNPPDSFTKFVDFFADDMYYFLVQQHGGQSLFDFVKQCHVFIAEGVIDISVWHSFCKAAMIQMMDLIQWMHNDMYCCHLDISLENFVIDNVNIVIDRKTRKIERINNDFQIKIIDFGLAEVFTKINKAGITDFHCSKHVGKSGYKSPEIQSKKKRFDARSADCWSLGVVFFMMLIGSPPFIKASKKDASYSMIINGQMIELLYDWDRLSYVNADLVDLLQRCLVKEKYRLNIKEIQRHRVFV